jgi:hypothetical protein
MFNSKYVSSTTLDFLKEDILSFFFFLVAMATRVLHGIKFFEQMFKVTTKGTFLWSLDEIGLVVYEEIWFKVNFTAGWMPDEKRSQKLTMSLCDRWAKNNIKTQNYEVTCIWRFVLQNIDMTFKKPFRI